MLWNFFRRKNKKVKEEIKLGVDLNEINGIIDENNLFSILKENRNITEEVESEKESKNNEQYKDNERYELQRGVSMKFLVVLDTSNVSQELTVKEGGTIRGLPPALHNFYIIEANDSRQAKDVVIWTFRHVHPALKNQIAHSLKATPLKHIIDTLHDDYRIWSYISPKGSSRQPGQQAKVPQQRVNPNNRDEVVPITEAPPPPPVSWDNTPKINKTPQPKINTEEIDPSNPMAAMASMMQQMQNMMAQMGQGGDNSQETKSKSKSPVTVRKVDNPQEDPELMQRMRSVLEGSSQTRRSVGEDFGDDDELSGAERQAQQEVENFKNLPPEQQAAAAQLDIDLNDNSDIDPSQFKNLVGRDSDGSEA